MMRRLYLNVTSGQGLGPRWHGGGVMAARWRDRNRRLSLNCALFSRLWAAYIDAAHRW
jgi:hypothetical protein